MAGLVMKRSERKQVLREEAIERNSAYQKQISTPEGIQQYIALTPLIGKKQLAKLNTQLFELLTLQKRKK
jgi:Trm5-related predicted tRNA methylase